MLFDLQGLQSLIVSVVCPETILEGRFLAGGVEVTYFR